MQDDEHERELVAVADLDVLVMRNDPADDMTERPWAVTSGVLFAQLSVAAGTLVVNDPGQPRQRGQQDLLPALPGGGAAPHADLPRPEARSPPSSRRLGGGAVLKPLQGSGGAGVFFVSDEESPNLNQMIEALGRDGYIVAQEVLPEAEQGDVRLFLMNGEPLVADGHHAAFRRVNTTRRPSFEHAGRRRARNR